MNNVSVHNVETSKNATYSILNIKLPNFVCTLANIWLIFRTQMVGIEKFLEIDQRPQT